MKKPCLAPNFYFFNLENLRYKLLSYHLRQPPVCLYNLATVRMWSCKSCLVDKQTLRWSVNFIQEHLSSQQLLGCKRLALVWLLRPQTKQRNVSTVYLGKCNLQCPLLTVTSNDTWSDITAENVQTIGSGLSLLTRAQHSRRVSAQMHSAQKSSERSGEGSCSRQRHHVTHESHMCLFTAHQHRHRPSSPKALYTPSSVSSTCMTQLFHPEIFGFFWCFFFEFPLCVKCHQHAHLLTVNRPEPRSTSHNKTFKPSLVSARVQKTLRIRKTLSKCSNRGIWLRELSLILLSVLLPNRSAIQKIILQCITEK